MIAAQITAIVSVFLSWVWWVTFCISLIGLALFQIPWCCRQTQGTVYGSVAIAGGIALVNMGVGIWILVKWKTVSYCKPFNPYVYGDIYGDDIYYREKDECAEEAWGSIAMFCGFLWWVVAGCMLYFVRSGRHSKWEALHSKSSARNNGDDDYFDDGGDDNAGVVELESAPAREPKLEVVTAAILAPAGTDKVDSTGE